MAKDAKPETAQAEAAPPKKSKKLLVLIAAALVLFLAIGGAAAFFMTRNPADGEDGEAVSEKVQVDKKKKNGKEAAPVYVALETFLVNLVPENGDQFLQLVISIEVSDSGIGDRIKMYTPKLRNNVMLLLSAKKASELMTRDGKETLANEVRELMNEILTPGDKAASEEPPVREVLFTSFIIQ